MISGEEVAAETERRFVRGGVFWGRLVFSGIVDGG